MKTFKHGGAGGDMVYGMATMYNLGGGILHMNFGANKFYHSLLMIQDYIEDIKYYRMHKNEWGKFKADYNLDLFRQQPFNSGYTLVECHMMAMNIKFDLTKPWFFNIKENHIKDIVINDTGKLRWEGITIDWDVLKDYKDRCVFIGHEGEHKNFERDRMKIDYYRIEDALDFAQVIKGSKFYVGNQSTGLAIAEGLKHPRFADLYLGRSKQYPKGPTGHWEISKELVEKYLNG
jgi:hypothetical protein